MKKYILLSLSLIMLLSSSCKKKITTATVSGFVQLYSPDEKLISSESVQIRIDSIDTVYASADGYFEFKNLPQGTYEIKISEPNVRYEYGFYGIQVLPTSEKIFTGRLRLIQKSDVVITDTVWLDSYSLKVYFTSSYVNEGDNLDLYIFGTDSTYNIDESNYWQSKSYLIEKDSKGKYFLISPLSSLFGDNMVLIPYKKSYVYSKPSNQYGVQLEKYQFQATFGEEYHLTHKK